jgi:hydrogenase maturation protease
MADDSIGIRVTRMVQARVPQRPDLVFKELSVSGIRLVEEMLGFDQVILVDSHTGKEPDVGRIRKLTPDDFEDTIHPGTPHDTNFASAMEFYRTFNPEKIPKLITIYTIDIDAEIRFGDQLSLPVEKAGEQLVNLLVRELGSG